MLTRCTIDTFRKHTGMAAQEKWTWTRFTELKLSSHQQTGRIGIGEASDPLGLTDSKSHKCWRRHGQPEERSKPLEVSISTCHNGEMFNQSGAGSTRG